MQARGWGDPKILVFAVRALTETVAGERAGLTLGWARRDVVLPRGRARMLVKRGDGMGIFAEWMGTDSWTCRTLNDDTQVIGVGWWMGIRRLQAVRGETGRSGCSSSATLSRPSASVGPTSLSRTSALRILDGDGSAAPPP